MQRNGPWALLVPLIPWAVGAAATAGGGYWGYRRFQEYRTEQEQDLEQRQLAARSAQQRSEAVTSRTLEQLKPLFIAGTIATTGIGTLVMLRGIRRERMSRDYY